MILYSLFDIAHSDALNIIKIDEDKQFLINQRLFGRPGCLSGVNKKETIKENRREIRNLRDSTNKLVVVSKCKLHQLRYLILCS